VIGYCPTDNSKMKNIPPLLLEHVNEIKSIDPSTQKIKYKLGHWTKRLGEDVDLYHIAHRFPGCITRQSVFELSKEASKTTELTPKRRLFLASMIFGFGTVGYGGYRTAEMFKSPLASFMIENTFELIRFGYLEEAYLKFSLPWCGTAFYTKYFYFIGYGINSLPMPLILDTNVARGLEERLLLDVTQYAIVNRDSDGHIGNIARPFWNGYWKYILDLNDWAEEIGCSPDNIEIFLFQQGKF
jgi:hypothetical protein